MGCEGPRYHRSSGGRGAAISHRCVHPRVLSADFNNNTSPGAWRQFYDAPSYREFFETAEEAKWKYILPTTVEGVVTRALSKSYISALPEDERTKVADNLRSVLETEEKKWVNKEEGVFEYPYETAVVTVRRK